MKMRYAKLADEQPYQRTGICHGKVCERVARSTGRRPDVSLFRTREYVYRCAACFRRETGVRP